MVQLSISFRSQANCESEYIDINTMLCSKLLLVLLLTLGSARSARILALFPLNAKSHFLMFSALLTDLSARGHHVTLLSHFPLAVPQDNYTFLDLSGSLVDMSDSVPMSWLDSLSWKEKFTFVWYENSDVCNLLGHAQSQKLLHSEDKYDLIITELFGTDCFLGFPYKFQVPFIAMTSSVAMPWGNDRVGNPDHPAYIPSYYLPYTDRMTFWQRLVNLVVNVGVKIAYRVISEKPSYSTAKKYFGDDLPSLSEIGRNTSLILVNSHFSLNQPRPLVPGVVEVGGLHIQEAEPLPKELEAFMASADHGVIFFSLGSIFDSSTLPEAKLSAFLSTFASLPQKVLWKIEGLDGMDLPSNVKTMKWLPQHDILSHRKTVLFITHGGLMGTQEAVHAGVPLLGIPLFADQQLNVQKYVQEGMGVRLTYEDISRKTVLDGINTVLKDARYTENARRLSRLFRDRASSARETAVFWTEYVIRHNGARHMRAQAALMPTSQYLLLDVQEAIIAGVLVLLVISYTIMKNLVSLCKFSFSILY